jgi:hypothetical protein
VKPEYISGAHFRKNADILRNCPRVTLLDRDNVTVFAWSASICLNFHSKVTIFGRAVNTVTGCVADSCRPLGPPSLVAKGCNGLDVGLTTLLHLLRGYL